MNPESLPQVKPGDSVKADHHNALVKAIRRRTPVSSPTIKIVETSSGFYCEQIRTSQQPATAAEPITHQWQPVKLTDTTLRIVSGRVNGTTPTGMSSVAVNAELLQYVHVKQAVTVTTSSSFVTGFTPGALTIDVHTSERTSTDSIRYYLLFTWQAGAVVTQLMRHNIGLMVRDARAGSPGTTEWLDWLAAS